ncbi:MAG: hypothetical protein WCI74_19830, partial [Actinomycetes bacterium]
VGNLLAELDEDGFALDVGFAETVGFGPEVGLADTVGFAAVVVVLADTGPTRPATTRAAHPNPTPPAIRPVRARRPRDRPIAAINPLHVHRSHCRHLLP